MFGERRAYQTGTSPVGVVAGAFDMNPGIDLATADEGGTLTLLANRGDGVFAPGGQIDIEDRYTVTAVVSGRFNSDDFSDFAIAANDAENPTFAGATVFYRSMGATQYTSSAVAVGRFPTCILNADLTGDGISDVATCSSNPAGGGLVSIFRGRADLSFTPPVSVPLPNTVPRRLAGADLDQDGHPDLVLIDTDGDSVWIAYGIEEPQFEAAVRLAVVNKPSAATILRPGSDGLPAIAVASSGDNAVVVFRQSQPRSFLSGASYSVGQGPADLAAADVDDDDRPDLLVANADADTVSILSGNADSTFSLGQTVQVGDRPVAIVVADLNGDTKPDFATADQNDVTFGPDVQSVSVVLNGSSPALTPTPTVTSPPTFTATATRSPTRTRSSTPTVTGTRPTSTPTPRITPTPAGPFDVNCDGRFDQGDLDTLIAAIFEEEQSSCLAERPTAADIPALLQALDAAR